MLKLGGDRSAATMLYECGETLEEVGRTAESETFYDLGRSCWIPSVKWIG